MYEKTGGSLALTSLNHISLVCCSVETSLDFYQNVLGFFPIRRPGSFDFDGAWLFSYGIGIHLLQSEDPESMPKKSVINPKDNHISFQLPNVIKIFDKLMFVGKCESMNMVEKKLKEMCIEYVKRRVEEGGIFVDQIFFHDPDGFMIEICNCDNLPVVPLAGEPVRTCGRVSFKNFQPHQQKKQQQQQQSSHMVQCLPTIHVNEDYSTPCA